MNKTYTPTYYKIVFLISISSLLGLLLFSYLYYNTIQQEKKIYTLSSVQFSNEVNSLMLLKSEALFNLTHDLTFWDEFVEFVKTKEKDRDLNWYEENIVSIGESYNVDYVATYDINKSIILENNFRRIKSLQFIPKEVLTEVFKKKQIKFYYKIPEGVIEVHATTIHASNDPEKTITKPSGYLITAKLFNEDYFTSLKNISSSTIQFLEPKTTLPSNKANIYALIELKNYNGENIKNLLFTRPFNLNFSNTTNILLIVFFILNLIANAIFIKKILFNPLNLIKNILEKNDQKAIYQLTKKTGEFGYIGTLFSENNKQKEELIIAKEKAEESDKLKSAFLQNLSHEIRTPMNAIIGFSELLDDSNLNEAKKTQYLKIIKSSGNNLISIIDDLIEMSKIDANQMKPNYKAFNLLECLIDVQNAVELSIPINKPIELNFINPKIPLTLLLVSDELKLKQILINLLNNAIKFTNEGVISFSYETDSKNKIILFKVTDTGIGIEEKEQKEIFNRFKRVHTDETINKSGVGLGLAISKAYIEMLNGSIWIESKKNIGSIFSFSIPLKTDSLNSTSIISQAKSLTHKNKTILVAEDDENNFFLISVLLNQKGYKIIRANNGLEAVNICFKNRNIDLVLMDIKMPKLSGLDAQKQIKVFNPSLPIIAVSAYILPDSKSEIIDFGFKDSISKPLVKEELFEAINNIFISTKNLDLK